MHQAARVESMPMVATQTPLSNAWRESVKRGPQLLEHWEKTYFKSVNSQKENTEDIISISEFCLSGTADSVAQQ